MLKLKARLERLERKRRLLARIAERRAREARSPEEKAFHAFVEALCIDDDFMRALQAQLVAVEEAFPVDLDRPATVNLGGHLVHYDTVREALKSWGKSAILTEEERALLDQQMNEAVQRAVLARWEARKRTGLALEAPSRGRG